jgi:GTP-binding protein
VEEETSFGGVRLLLVDTGGFRLEGDELERLVVERSLRSAEEADVVLLVLDVGAVSAEDESFIELLRPMAERLILVVNKVDNPARDLLVWNFHSYGFPRVVGVSAAHQRNLDDLKELVALLLGPECAEKTGDVERAERMVRVAILGKPNSGKSSLSNLLLGEEKSIVSPIPGTTRDVVEGSFLYGRTLFRLLDTAGIRRRSRVTDSVEYYSVTRAVESVREADIVFLMVDSVDGLSDQDKKIAAFAAEKGRGIILVLSKWDLQPRGGEREKAAREMVRFLFPILSYAPLVPVSAVTGEGVKDLLGMTIKQWSQLNDRVGTGRLNQALEGWTDHYPLPARGRYKIRFATQVGVNPVRFVVFVNRLAGFPHGYVQYLENCIRRDLGFSMIPVVVELRQSKKPWP